MTSKNTSASKGLKEHTDGTENYHTEVLRVNNRILKAIESVKGKTFLHDVISTLASEAEFWSDPSPNSVSWDLVKKPAGKRYKDKTTLVEVSVWEWEVDDEEISERGILFIKLKKNLWLSVSYSHLRD